MAGSKRCGWIVAVLAGLLATGCSQKTGPEPAPAHDAPKAGPAVQAAPQEVAKQILAAYKARDHARLLALSNATNQPIMKQLAEQGEKHPRYKSIHGGWRARTVESWNGRLGDVRYPSPTEAWVAYQTDERGDEVFVVVLTLEDGKWLFEDINSPSKERFEKAPRTP